MLDLSIFGIVCYRKIQCLNIDFGSPNSNSDLAIESWYSFEARKSVGIDWIKCRSLVCVEMLENEVLDDWKRHNGVKCPDFVFANSIINTQMESSADSEPEPSTLSVQNEWSGKDECYQVPEYVWIPTNQSFPEECHQECRRLDSKKWIEAEVHHAVAGQKMTSNPDELEESIAKSYRSWGSEVVGVLLAIEFASNSCCISFSITACYFISTHMMNQYNCKKCNVIDLIVLKGPQLWEKRNGNATKRKYNGVQAVFIPNDKWSLQNPCW